MITAENHARFFSLLLCKDEAHARLQSKVETCQGLNMAEHFSQLANLGEEQVDHLEGSAKPRRSLKQRLQK